MRTINKLSILICLIALLPAIVLAGDYSVDFNWDQYPYALTTVDSDSGTFVAVSTLNPRIISDDTWGAPGVLYYKATFSIPPGKQVTDVTCYPSWRQPVENLDYHLSPCVYPTSSTYYNNNTGIPLEAFENPEFPYNSLLYNQTIYPPTLIRSFATDYTKSGQATVSIVFAVNSYTPATKTLKFLNRINLTLTLTDAVVEVPTTMSTLAFKREVSAISRIVDNPRSVQANICTQTALIDAPEPVFWQRDNAPLTTGLHQVRPDWPRTGVVICTQDFANDPSLIRWVNWQIEHARVYDIVTVSWIDHHYNGNGIWEDIAMFLFTMDSTSYAFSDVQFVGVDVPAPLTSNMNWDTYPGYPENVNVVSYSDHYYRTARPPYYNNADGDLVCCEPDDHTMNRIWYNVGRFEATNSAELAIMVNADIGFNDDLYGSFGLNVVTLDESTDSLVDEQIAACLSHVPPDRKNLFFEGIDGIRNGYVSNPNQEFAPNITGHFDEWLYNALLGDGTPDIQLTMRPFYDGNGWSFFDLIQVGDWSTQSGVKVFGGSYTGVQPGPWDIYDFEHSLAHYDQMRNGSIAIGYNREAYWKRTAYTYGTTFDLLDRADDDANITYAQAHAYTNYSHYHNPGFNPYDRSFYGSVTAVNAKYTRKTIVWGDSLLPPTEINDPTINYPIHLQVFLHDPYIGGDQSLEGAYVVAFKDGEYIGCWVTNQFGLIHGHVSTVHPGHIIWRVFMPSDYPANELAWVTTIGRKHLEEKEHNHFKAVENSSVPTIYSLSNSFPNPFNAQTKIDFDLPEAANVTIDVFNISGQRVGTILDEYKNAGTHQVIWNAGDFASGVYYYRIHANAFTSTKKCMLLK